MDFFDVVKNIGSLLGLFLSFASAIGVVAKFQNKHYKRLFDEHSEEMRKNVEKQIEEIKKNDKKQTEEITEIKNTLNNLTTKVDGLQKRFDVVEDFNAEICRNTIKNIYYQYNKTQKIPLYERKMADSLYKMYSEQFHQNSYGQLLYQEICKWEIDTTDKLTM